MHLPDDMLLHGSSVIGGAPCPCLSIVLSVLTIPPRVAAESAPAKRVLSPAGT